MESIFFEKQEGQLCAQHALNALLQGAYFTAVDLAEFARQLDQEESSVLGGGAPDRKSQNMDDSGYFSVQVMSKALEVWNLELLPLNSPRAAQIKAEPTFNLNSLLNGPRLVSDTYLDLFLAQLINDGYSIFVVVGDDLPHCQADDVLRVTPIDPALAARSDPIRDDAGSGNEDPELARAIALSLGNTASDNDVQAAISASKKFDESQDPSLQKALQSSLDGFDPDQDEHLQMALELSMRASEQAASSNSSSSSNCLGNSASGTNSDFSANNQIKIGLPDATSNVGQKSTVQSTVSTAAPAPTDPETVRRQRQAFLDRLNNGPSSAADIQQ